MEFLKELLGDDLFAQVAEKINAHNGNEANANNKIKLANLETGDYVGKGKYDALVEQIAGKQAELDTANGLITDLKANTKGVEEIQAKINSYETQVADLQAELDETKRKSALKVALLAEKALDIDYLTYKVQEDLAEQGKTLELDENENIKGIDDLISGLKTRFKTQFSAKETQQVIEPNKLPNSEKREGFTKEELLKKNYAERQAIYEENPEAYKAAMNS